MSEQSSDFRILDSNAVSAMGSKFRLALLESLVEPDSAASLARRFDMSRQRIGYHMRELEKAGCIELAGERQQRGLTERLFRVRPMAYAFGPPAARSERGRRDRYSWASLLNLVGGALWDLVRLRQRADAAGRRLATLAIEAELRFSSPRARSAFSRDLIAAIDDVVARHNEPDAEQGRNFRLVLGAYPSLTEDQERSVNHERIDTRD